MRSARLLHAATLAASLWATALAAEPVDVRLSVAPEAAGPRIKPEVYGQQALRKLEVPVVRWPGDVSVARAADGSTVLALVNLEPQRPARGQTNLTGVARGRVPTQAGPDGDKPTIRTGFLLTGRCSTSHCGVRGHIPDGHRRAPPNQLTCRAALPQNGSRSTVFKTLPADESGRASRNSMVFGHL
jgi:hypothetical protein